jgi:phosphate transport system substrate-binding protein
MTRQQPAGIPPSRYILVWLCLLLTAGAACRRATDNELTLAGSTSVQPFAEKWADAYRAARPGVAIQVQGGGSTTGVQAAMSGAAQIGMASRALTAEEASRVRSVVVARDGIAIVVHPSQPASDLTLEQVRAIYTGEVRSWSQWGGGHRPVTVITREEGSGTRAAFEALVMGGRRIAASALVQDATGAVRQMVASDPAAIGFVSIGFVDPSIKALRLHGVDATEANIDRGSYPLVRPFSFVIPAQPRPGVMDFVNWITGPEGRELTRREGLLPPGA